MNELDIELPEGYRMTELGPLPEEWEVVNLSEVMDLRRGVSWRKEEANREGIGTPVIGIPNIKENGSIDFADTYFLNKNIPEERVLRTNDIVFVGSSGSIKNIGRNVFIREIPQNTFTYASFTFLGRVRSMKGDSEYLFYLLNSRVVDFTKYARRASDGKYNFQLTQFKNEQKIPLPPLLEQKKIAAVLSTIQEAKARTEAVISATRDLKNSMMKYLFTYGPVPLPEAENVPLKETEIGMIPEEWEVVRLGDVAEFNLGRTPKRVNESYWDDGKYPWVSIADMSDFGYIYDTKEKVSQKAYEEVFKKRLVPKETLLMSFKLTIGRTSILKTDAFHNEAIISIRPNNNQVLKEFLFYFLPTIDFSNYYDNVVKGKTLNSAKIKKLLISLPPLSTQQKIASMLSAIDEKIEAEENKKKALDDLFNTLLHDLMTAKIRVNHLDLDEIELSV